jgi:hypothetical protein
MYTMSEIFDKITDFRWIPKDEIEAYPLLAHDKALEFIKMCEDGDEFYNWCWQPSGLMGAGGVCIFRNNRPIYAIELWIS